uniref:Uncharacterized protein n=1 Tax=Setaria digitata TaxID=48799 RepID=A0A915PZ52_9BILA
MDSDGNDERCLVEQLRKELQDLTRKEKETRRVLKKNQRKNQESEKAKNEIKLILEKEEIEIAKKEEELKHFQARVRLQRGKVENMRQQILINQMREAEANEQIEELKKTLEEVNVKEKADHQFLKDRLKTVQNKLMNASWVILHFKAKEELTSLCKQIEDARTRKDRLLQSIQKKEATFAESCELPFINFCIATAALALKNRALLKKLAQEYVFIARLTQDLSSQGILDTSALSQYNQSQTNQNQLLEEKIEGSSLCLNNANDADAGEEKGSFERIREEIVGESLTLNFQAENEICVDSREEIREELDEQDLTTPDDKELKGNVMFIVVNEEIEKKVSNTAMEVDKSLEVLQVSNELSADSAQSEETIDMIEKEHILSDVNSNGNATCNKDNNIDSNSALHSIDCSKEVETTITRRSEEVNTVHYNDDICEPVRSVNLQPGQNSSSDLDPTNFFASFTSFAPNVSAVNLSNPYLGMDTEFDASAIFNFSAVMQNQSGSVTGANDYMALFGGADTNSSTRDNEGFDLNFDSLPGENETREKIDKTNRFFNF